MTEVEPAVYWQFRSAYYVAFGTLLLVCSERVNDNGCARLFEFAGLANIAFGFVCAFIWIVERFPSL